MRVATHAAELEATAAASVHGRGAAIDRPPVALPNAPSLAVRIAATALAIGVFAAYFVTLHVLLVRGDLPTLAIAMIVAPWLLFAAPLVTRDLRSGRFVRILLALCVGIVLAWAIVRFGPTVGHRADTVLYVENLAFFGWLTGLFGFSLAGDREPFVTRMARKTRRGDMPPSVVRYTRALTIAWAAFFAASIALSTWLWLTQSRELWSLYINVLMWPIVGFAFVLEYLVRITMLKDIEHVPFSAAIHAFRDRSDASR